MALCRNGFTVLVLRGMVTDADLAQAESEWPGLNDFLDGLPFQQRPATFLELIWRFECRRGDAET
jgi:hypothetical protein